MENRKLFLTCQSCSMLVGCNNGQMCEDCPDASRLKCVTVYDEQQEKSNGYVAIATETCEFCPVEVVESEMPAGLST